MICHFSIVQVHFVFCQLNFIVLFPFLIKYYHILFIVIVFRLLGSDKLSPVSSTVFHKGSVTGCDSSLWSFCDYPVYFLSCMHLHFGYYYYDCAVMGVLRLSLFTVILFWIGLLLSKDVKQHKIMIIIIVFKKRIIKINNIWGRVDDLSFFECSGPFYFF